MSFLDKIFGKNEPENHQQTFWKNMCHENDLKDAVENSHRNKVVIFKHSTRCFISRTVLKNFENEVQNSDKNIDYYYLDLLACRSLSSKIAEQFGVEHQSPQIIVLENGIAIGNASHQAISLNLV